MPDQIRYDLLTQQALRGVVRNVLTDAAKKGLPGDHHFFIEFDTHADGVRMSDRLRAQHPDKMTIILQHQFWNLTVNDTGFEVGLSFGGITEKLGIPFDAIKGFFDPSVQFGLQFEEVSEALNDDRQAPANGQDSNQPADQKRGPSALGTAAPMVAQTGNATSSENRPATKLKAKLEALPSDKSGDKPDETSGPPDKPNNGGGEVVRLDRFRKK